MVVMANKECTMKDMIKHAPKEVSLPLPSVFAGVAVRPLVLLVSVHYG